jgi:hypothetical protein
LHVFVEFFLPLTALRVLVWLLLISTGVWVDLVLDKLDPVVLSLDDFIIGVGLLISELIEPRKLGGGIWWMGVGHLWGVVASEFSINNYYYISRVLVSE